MRRRAIVPEDLDPAARFLLNSIVSTDGGGRTAWWRVEAKAGLRSDSIRGWLYTKRRGDQPVGLRPLVLALIVSAMLWALLIKPILWLRAIGFGFG